jgi:hypothetical protein
LAGELFEFGVFDDFHDATFLKLFDR